MKKLLVIIVVVLFSLPILFYGIGDLIRAINRVHVKDEFYIEYLEMYNSISLWNNQQGFVANVKEAYWNKDSLVVAGEKGCFLIIFEETKYNDEMILISCDHLKDRLNNGPLKHYKKKQK